MKVFTQKLLRENLGCPGMGKTNVKSDMQGHLYFPPRLVGGSCPWETILDEDFYGQSLLRRSTTPCMAGEPVVLKREKWGIATGRVYCAVATHPVRLEQPCWCGRKGVTGGWTRPKLPVVTLRIVRLSFNSRRRQVSRTCWTFLVRGRLADGRLSNTGVPWVCVWTPNS